VASSYIFRLQSSVISCGFTLHRIYFGCSQVSFPVASPFTVYILAAVKCHFLWRQRTYLCYNKVSFPVVQRIYLVCSQVSFPVASSYIFRLQSSVISCGFTVYILAAVKCQFLWRQRTYLYYNKVSFPVVQRMYIFKLQSSAISIGCSQQGMYLGHSQV
jgi:hypothetical protein